MKTLQLVVFATWVSGDQEGMCDTTVSIQLHAIQDDTSGVSGWYDLWTPA